MVLCRRPWRLALGIVWMFGVMPATWLGATTTAPTTEWDLVHDSAWIGTAEVGASRSQWFGRQLWTLVELRVTSQLKGVQPEPQMLLLPGGRDPEAGISTAVAGATPFLPMGVEVLVFGRPSPRVAGAIEPLGMAQGVVLLRSDEDRALLARIGEEISRQRAQGSGR